MRRWGCKQDTGLCFRTEKWLYTYQPCCPLDPPGGKNTSTYLQEREREKERQENQWPRAQLYHNSMSERFLCFLGRRRRTSSVPRARSENKRQWEQKSRMNLLCAWALSKSPLKISNQRLIWSRTSPWLYVQVDHECIESDRRIWNFGLELRSTLLLFLSDNSQSSLQHLKKTNNTHPFVIARFHKTSVCFQIAHIGTKKRLHLHFFFAILGMLERYFFENAAEMYQLERKYEGFHRVPYTLAPTVLMGCEEWRLMAKQSMSRSGAMPGRLGHNRDVSNLAVTDRPELMCSTIEGPVRWYATSELPSAMTERDEASNRFCNTVTHSGTISSFLSFDVPH